MTNHPEYQIGLPAGTAVNWQNAGAPAEPQLVHFALDESPHSSDGLLLHCWDGAEPVTAFISRHVMDDWVDPRRSPNSRKSLLRREYNALGKRNLPAIQRIVSAKYRRGPAFNRQHPFVDVLWSDITESGEALDVSGLATNTL